MTWHIVSAITFFLCAESAADWDGPQFVIPSGASKYQLSRPWDVQKRHTPVQPRSADLFQALAVRTLAGTGRQPHHTPYPSRVNTIESWKQETISKLQSLNNRDTSKLGLHLESSKQHYFIWLWALIKAIFNHWRFYSLKFFDGHVSKIWQICVLGIKHSTNLHIEWQGKGRSHSM